MGINRWFWLALSVAGCASNSADDATFVAWGSSTSSITLAWQPVDGATGYELDRDGRDPVMLPGDATAYLDGSLAEGTYAYHLTALGVTAPPEDAKASTSADPAVVTTDDAPIGDPVTGTGMIELPAARASVADGTTLTLQAITPPTGAPDTAIAISSDTPPTAPVDIAFALDDDELGNLANVAIAAKQPDGTWVSVPARLDGDRAVVTAAAEPHHAFVAPGAWQWKFVKFRRIRIDPNPVNVRGGSEVAVFAQKVFSDDVCEVETPTWCRLANGGVGFNELGIPLPRPLVIPHRVKNSEGTWAVDGPGTIDAVPDEHSATYTAPSAKPAANRWSISFTTKRGTPMTATAVVQLLSNKFQLTLHYDNPNDVLATGYEGEAIDELFFGIDASGTAITVVDGPYNMTTEVMNPHSSLAGVKVTESSPYEVFTADHLDIGADNGELAMTIYGTAHDAGVTLTFGDGSTTMIPSVTTHSTLFMRVPGVRFEAITGTKWFDVPGTQWQLRVSPIAPL